MDFAIEVLSQTLLMTISGLLFAFFVWKLKRRKSDFGGYLDKYGELLAYVGLFFIALIIFLIQE